MTNARFVRSNLIALGVLLTIAVCGCGKKEGDAAKSTDKPPTETKPATYEGTWSGNAGSGFHVQEIVIAGNEFPCKGSVVLQFGGGQKFNFNVSWDQKDGQLHGMYSLLGASKSIASAKLDGDTLSGEVSAPITIPNAPTGVSYSGFKKAGK